MAYTQKERDRHCFDRNREKYRAKAVRWQAKRKARLIAEGKWEEWKAEQYRKQKEYYAKNKDKKRVQALRWDYVLWWTRTLDRIHGPLFDKSEQKEKVRLRAKQWSKDNPDKVLERSRTRWKFRSRNPAGHIRSAVAARVRDFMAGKKGASKLAKELLGCSMSEFVLHLQRQFTSEMSWENYGKKDGWQIDHIIPCAAFDMTNQDEIKKCFHYSNQQPLMAVDNAKKGDLLPDGRRARDLGLIKQFGCSPPSSDVCSTP